MNQKGIAPALILILIAVIAVVVAILYGYTTVNRSSEPVRTETSAIQNPLEQQTPSIGTPQCPELDYTGCDTSQNFMTWTDDNIR